MKYPYTMSAKLAMFPWQHHFSGHWIYKYTFFGCIASLPVFMWITEKRTYPSLGEFNFPVFKLCNVLNVSLQ